MPYKMTGVAAGVLLASSFLLPASQAAAQPVSGIYIGGGAGWNWLQDTDINVRGTSGEVLRSALPGADSNGKLENEDGWVGVLSVGWGFGNGLRAEVEGNFRENSSDSLSGFGSQGFQNIGGKTRSWGAMVNAFYDFDLYTLFGGPRWIQPYLGAGIGWARTQLDGVDGTTANGTRLLIDGEEDVFAYQGIVGAGFPISAVPGLAITTEYRFFGTTKPEIGSRVTTASGGFGRGNVEISNDNHSVMLGVRYAFNAVPPAPPPAPVAPAPAAAPAPARTYLVFFDWDRSDLTNRARQIIAEAAQNSTRVQVTRIEVAGHADRSGSAQYNQRLSQRRADTVANELVRLGVDRSIIVVQAFGESRPLVPTADGVREPQNRRVEIILR
ncbi:putative outer membrane protein [Acetobacteraceae bacterium AT-5844]|nr:putative outer membrane protein [Acetobacteraceae bacterium AT-5844]